MSQQQGRRAYLEVDGRVRANIARHQSRCLVQAPPVARQPALTPQALHSLCNIAGGLRQVRRVRRICQVRRLRQLRAPCFKQETLDVGDRRVQRQPAGKCDIAAGAQADPDHPARAFGVPTFSGLRRMRAAAHDGGEHLRHNRDKRRPWQCTRSPRQMRDKR